MAAPDRPSLEKLEEQWMTFYLDKGYTDDALTAKVQAALAKARARRGSQGSMCFSFLFTSADFLFVLF